MAARKKKPAPNAKSAAKSAARPAGPRKRTKAAPPPPPPPPAMPLDQELLLLARGAAGSLKRMLITLLVLASVGLIAATLWALRPVPTFSSEDLATGSPFDVTFRVRNRNSWLGLANLKISCVLAQVRALPVAPTLVDATNLRLAGKDTHGLEPGESGTFTCPFRATLDQPMKDDPDVAQRAEIYFRSEYDLPLLGSLRLTHDSARFSLNTRVIPPRWTVMSNR